MASELVGDTGFEPVTSSVSRWHKIRVLGYRARNLFDCQHIKAAACRPTTNESANSADFLLTPGCSHVGDLIFVPKGRWVMRWATYADRVPIRGSRRRSGAESCSSGPSCPVRSHPVLTTPSATPRRPWADVS